MNIITSSLYLYIYLWIYRTNVTTSALYQCVNCTLIITSGLCLYEHCTNFSSCFKVDMTLSKTAFTSTRYMREVLFKNAITCIMNNCTFCSMCLNWTNLVAQRGGRVLQTYTCTWCLSDVLSLNALVQ